MSRDHHDERGAGSATFDGDSPRCSRSRWSRGTNTECSLAALLISAPAQSRLAATIACSRSWGLNRASDARSAASARSSRGEIASPSTIAATGGSSIAGGATLCHGRDPDARAEHEHEHEHVCLHRWVSVAPGVPPTASREIRGITGGAGAGAVDLETRVDFESTAGLVEGRRAAPHLAAFGQSPGRAHGMVASRLRTSSLRRPRRCLTSSVSCAAWARSARAALGSYAACLLSSSIWKLRLSQPS